MRDSRAWIIAYAAILSFVCATCLTVVSAFTKPLYERNKLEEQRFLALLALGLVPPGKAIGEVYEGKTAVEVYREKGIEEEIRPFQPPGSREEETVRILRYREGGALEAVAFDLAGQGLWSTIRAFVALEPDYESIRSVVFYDQEETPGLGAEIATAEFQDRFRDKRLLGEGGEPAVRVVKAGARKDPAREIDGISGATITGDGVNEILEKAAALAREIRETGGES